MRQRHKTPEYLRAVLRRPAAQSRSAGESPEARTDAAGRDKLSADPTVLERSATAGIRCKQSVKSVATRQRRGRTAARHGKAGGAKVREGFQQRDTRRHWTWRLGLYGGLCCRGWTVAAMPAWSCICRHDPRFGGWKHQPLDGVDVLHSETRSRETGCTRTYTHASKRQGREAYCCRPDLAVNRLNVAIQSLEGRDPTDTQATLERLP